MHKVTVFAEPPWLRRHADGLLVQLLIRSGAKTTRVEGVLGDRLKLYVAAPPIEGRANVAITHAIATALGLSKQQVCLVSGLKSKCKTVLICNPNLDLAQAQRALERLGS